MKRTIKSIFFFMILSLVGSLRADLKKVCAYDITIVCEGDGTCDMYPAPDTKLFDYSGLLPGDSVTNTLIIQNTDHKNACNMTMRIFEDTESPAHFADNLWTVIKEAAVDFFGARDGETAAADYKNIQDVYNLHTINLGPLAANSTRVFDWMVTFNPLSGNDLQNALTRFDLKFNLTCKMCKKPCKHCIKFSKHCHKRDHWGGYEDCYDRDNRGGNKWVKGDHIKFTMEIRTDNRHYKDVRVADVPFHGCNYISDSWTAHSNKRGDLKRNGHMRGPRYGSPGVWEIGDLEPGEIITLTYEAEITDEEYIGNETDIAWVSAVDPEDSSIIFSNDEEENLLISSSPISGDNDTQQYQTIPDENRINSGFFARTKYLLNLLWNFFSRLIH